MDGAGSNLVKFMAERKKQRRNSIENLKKIISDAREEKPESKVEPKVEPKAPLRLETAPAASAPMSILDAYSMTPRRDSAVSGWASGGGGEKKATSSRESASFTFPAGEPEPSAPASTAPSKQSPIKDNDDATTILKKYARKSSKVFELGKQVSDLQQELKREKEKSSRIQEDYDALSAHKVEDGAAGEREAGPSDEERAQITDLTRKLSLAERELVTAKTEYTKLHGLYSKSLEGREPGPRAGEALRDVEASLASANQEISRLKSELGARSSELGAAREELAILREFRESVHVDQGERARLRGVLQKQSSDLMERDAQSSFLEGQLAACRQENKKLREDYEKVVKGEARLQLEIEGLRRENGMLTAQVDQYKGNEEMERQLKRELQNLAVDLSAKHEHNKQMLEQIAEKERVFEGRREAGASLERELALARNALKQSELERDRAVEQKREQHQEVLRLREEVSEMERARRQLGQLSKAFENLPAFSTLAKRHRTVPRTRNVAGDQPLDGAANLSAVFGRAGQTPLASPNLGTYPGFAPPHPGLGGGYASR